MIHRSLLYGASLVAVLLLLPAVAQAEYWITVGSFHDLDAAELTRAEATRLLPETFTVARAETDSGIWYRVLAGPYLSREIADHMRDEARRAGFEQAWILAQESGELAMAGYSGSYLSDPGLEPAAVEPFDEGQAGMATAAEPAEGSRQAPEEKAARTLIDEAPPGYQLHRLRRN